MAGVDWLDELARRHRGLIVRDDAIAAAGEREVRSLVRAGVLIPERPDVYRTVGTPRTWELDVVAVCLSVGDGCVPALGSAARLRRMRYVPASRVEVFAPRRVRLPGVKAHRTTLLPDSHLEFDKRIGLFVPSAARTVCDLSARLSADTLAKVMDSARRDKKLTYDDVWQCRDDLRARGRRRTTVLDDLLARRVPGLEQDESAGEALLLGWLLDAGIEPPEQQYWVVVNGMRYRCDLAYPRHKLDVEWDAFSTHGEDRTTFDYDKLRDDDFDAAGWGVVRVTSAWTRERAVAAVTRHLKQAA